MRTFVDSLVVEVAGGLVVFVIGFFAGRRWQGFEQDRQEDRLLRTFFKMAMETNPREKLSVAVFAPKAAERARIRDPEPVMARLLRKNHILRVPNDPGYYHVTPAGRQRVYDQPTPFSEVVSGKQPLGSGGVRQNHEQ